MVAYETLSEYHRCRLVPGGARLPKIESEILLSAAGTFRFVAVIIH